MAVTRHGRPHRWVNTKTEGATFFATSTCLDFANAFNRPEMREMACLSLMRDMQRYQCLLHAFVVMPNHLHLVATMNPQKTASWLLQRLNSNLAKLSLPRLTPSEHGYFDEQIGLSRRQFWKAGTRANPLVTSNAFYQKVRYTHLNPVRATLVETSHDYRWSSRRLWAEGLWNPERGLHIEESIERFDCSISTDIA